MNYNKDVKILKHGDKVVIVKDKTDNFKIDETEIKSMDTLRQEIEKLGEEYKKKKEPKTLKEIFNMLHYYSMMAEFDIDTMKELCNLGGIPTYDPYSIEMSKKQIKPIFDKFLKAYPDLIDYTTINYMDWTHKEINKMFEKGLVGNLPRFSYTKYQEWSKNLENEIKKGLTFENWQETYEMLNKHFNIDKAFEKEPNSKFQASKYSLDITQEIQKIDPRNQIVITYDNTKPEPVIITGTLIVTVLYDGKDFPDLKNIGVKKMSGVELCTLIIAITDNESEGKIEEENIYSKTFNFISREIDNCRKEYERNKKIRLDKFFEL